MIGDLGHVKIVKLSASSSNEDKRLARYLITLMTNEIQIIMTHFDNLWRQPQFYSLKSDFQMEKRQRIQLTRQKLLILFLCRSVQRDLHIHFPNNLRYKPVTTQFKCLLSQLHPSLQTSDTVSDAHEAIRTLFTYIGMSDRQDD